MSVRKYLSGLALAAALLVNTGCCCHKHRHACSPCGGGACNSCYASPASRTDVPSMGPIPVNPR